MSDERRGSGSGFGAGFVLLIFVGFVVKFWLWILAGLAAVALIVLVFVLVDRSDKRRAARLEHAAAIGRRADEQHAWTLARGRPRRIRRLSPGGLPERVKVEASAAARTAPRHGRTGKEFDTMSMAPENDVQGWRGLAEAVMGNVPAPAGAVSIDEWGDPLTPCAFRLFHGTTRTVELEHGDGVDVVIHGTQSADGSIEERGILIDGGSDDTITTDEARRLADALIAAADEIDRCR